VAVVTNCNSPFVLFSLPRAGLSNQGATCYLNGLLQTLFMTPEFRRALFKFKYNEEKDGAAEHCIPLQLQKLFGFLLLSKVKAVDTIALTKSFGWEGSEVFQQQDVQELTRVSSVSGSSNKTARCLPKSTRLLTTTT
jgi:ubiquitin C-terminal hydrolase